MTCKPTILNISTLIFLAGIMFYSIWEYKTLSAGEGWGIVSMAGLAGVGIMTALALAGARLPTRVSNIYLRLIRAHLIYICVQGKLILKSCLIVSGFVLPAIDITARAILRNIYYICDEKRTLYVQIKFNYCKILILTITSEKEKPYKSSPKNWIGQGKPNIYTSFSQINNNMNKIIITLFFTVFFLRTFSQDTIALTQYVGNLKKLDVTIGAKQYAFLFDTGGGETFISPEIAGFLKKEPYSKASGIRMTGEKIDFQKCESVMIDMGKTEIFHPVLGVWDVMNVLPKDWPEIDGVISLKSFNNHIVTVVLAENRLIIETPESYGKKIKNMTLLNSRFASGPDGNELTIFLSIPHNQHLYWLLFDSENIGQFVFSPQTAFEWGLQNDTSTVNKEYSTVIPLGTRKHQINVVTENIMYEGVFNFDFISKNVYTLDLIKKQVWTN